MIGLQGRSRHLSIHASTKDATRYYLFNLLWQFTFNPRIHEGCDCWGRSYCFFAIRFQSTHPRRMRHCSPPCSRGRETFQSTHPRRMRLAGILWICLWGSNFQSTHPRRMRQSYKLEAADRYVFQSTHPRRMRPPTQATGAQQLCFQSTHPRRMRQTSLLLSLS